MRAASSALRLASCSAANRAASSALRLASCSAASRAASSALRLASCSAASQTASSALRLACLSAKIAAASAVKAWPQRLQNRTPSFSSLPQEGHWGGSFSFKFAPHIWQNSASAFTLALHFGQTVSFCGSTTGAPHLKQNRSPSVNSAPHFEQRTIDTSFNNSCTHYKANHAMRLSHPRSYKQTEQEQAAPRDGIAILFAHFACTHKQIDRDKEKPQPYPILRLVSLAFQFLLVQYKKDTV